MEEKDVITREFISDNDRFADIMNVGLFQGKRILSGAQLCSMDSFSGTVVGKVRRRFAVHRIRDAIKKAAYGANFALIGVENQSEIHYAEPVRIMGYDFLNYDAQIRKIRRKHRWNKDLRGAQYLSGFAKDDKIKPIFTLILYWGKEPWDGPRKLSDMTDWTDIPEEIRNKVADYPISILDVRRFSESEKLTTDARIVFGFLQRESKTKELEEYIKENEKDFSNVDADAFEMLEIMTDSKELINLVEKDTRKGGKVNMCQAMREWAEEARNLGRAEGRAEAILDILREYGTVPEKTRYTVTEQKDEQILGKWLHFAIKVNSVKDFEKEISRL